MQEFKTAPTKKDKHSALGHAAGVCKSIIVTGTIIGVITEVLPLRSMVDAAIGQYLIPIIGEWSTTILVIVAVGMFVTFLALESIKASKAAFFSVISTNDDGNPSFNIKNDTAKDITFAGVFMLWIAVFAIIGFRIALTFIGSHQIAYVAVTPPTLNTATIAANDSLHNIRNGETSKEYDKQRQRLLADNKEALKAAKRLAVASEANAVKEVKNAPNEYRKNIATQKLKDLRAKNAEQIAVVSAQGSQALLSLSASQNNVIANNDSLNNAAKGMVISADAHAQKQYFWLSDKMTRYMPYISLVWVLLVTLAVFVLCLIERACGIVTTFQQDRYENLPGLPTVYLKAVSDVWQSWNRSLAAGIKNVAERDIFKGGEVDAAAVGAGNTVQIVGSGSVQDVQIRGSKIADNVVNNVMPDPITNNNEPPHQSNRVADRVVEGGYFITIFTATQRRNTYRSKIKNNEGFLETNQARLKYNNYLIDTMTKQGTDSMIAPAFRVGDWS
jgi:hypothetical protein